MYILKEKNNNIIAISDDLAYQENGNPLIHEGVLAISKHLVDVIEESNTTPEGWEKVGKIYQPIVIHPTPDELRQEGADALTEELIAAGII